MNAWTWAREAGGSWVLAAAVAVVGCGGGGTSGGGNGGASGTASSSSGSGITNGSSGGVGGSSGTGTVLTCQGTPDPCDPDACSTSLGCSPGGTCEGESFCDEQFDDFDCIDLSGCVWDPGTSTCSGFAESCGDNLEQGSCQDQSGCNWLPQCTGDPTPCDLLSASDCTSQPGCSLQ